MATDHDLLVTLEENVIAGGAGSAVAEVLNALTLLRPILHIGLPDVFCEHGSREDMLACLGLDAAGIEKRITDWRNRLKTIQPAPLASTSRS